MANTLYTVMKPCAHVTCKTCTDSLVRPAKQCIVCDTQLKEKDVIELKREGSLPFVIYAHSPSLSALFFFIRPFSALSFWFFDSVVRTLWILWGGGGALIWAHGSYVWIHASFLRAHDLLCVDSRLLCMDSRRLCIDSWLLCVGPWLLCVDSRLFVWAHDSHV